MKITYSAYSDWDEAQRKILNAHGIQTSEGYSRIDVDLTEENQEVINLLDLWRVKKYVGSTYEKRDYDSSQLFVYVGIWENGYPMPDDDMGYLNLTYDIDNYCPECGIGKIQKAPFRIKNKPNWGKKSMFELGWVYDEIFVRIELYESLFAGMRINYRPVLLHKTGEIIKDVVQLMLPSADSNLLLSAEHTFEVCKFCKRKKWSRQIAGFFPGFDQLKNNPEIFKCQEYFGSGGEAHNPIVITKSLRDKLKEIKINPRLIPIESTLVQG